MIENRVQDQTSIEEGTLLPQSQSYSRLLKISDLFQLIPSLKSSIEIAATQRELEQGRAIAAGNMEQLRDIIKLIKAINSNPESISLIRAQLAIPDDQDVNLWIKKDPSVRISQFFGAISNLTVAHEVIQIQERNAAQRAKSVAATLTPIDDAIVKSEEISNRTDQISEITEKLKSANTALIGLVNEQKEFNRLRSRSIINTTTEKAQDAFKMVAETGYSLGGLFSGFISAAGFTLVSSVGVIGETVQQVGERYAIPVSGGLLGIGLFTYLKLIDTPVVKETSWSSGVPVAFIGGLLGLSAVTGIGKASYNAIKDKFDSKNNNYNN